MKFISKKIILLSLLGMSFFFLTGCDSNMQRENNISQSADNLEYIVDESDILDTNYLLDMSSTSMLSDQERMGLIQMREEEKLARDVYTTLGDKRGAKIFSNIAESEQTHTIAVKNLLTIYDIPDPVLDDTVGKFTSSSMQKLYNDLISQGSNSLLDALTVGAIVEDLDISDLNQLIKQTDKENIITVYNNLNKGSRNHLRAYVKNINQNGGTYSPQYISLSEYNDIISSQQERGSNGIGKGKSI